MGGGLELMALLAVNTPGFPVPRLATLAASAAGGEEVDVALISASIFTAEVENLVAGCGCGNKVDTAEAIPLVESIDDDTVDPQLAFSAEKFALEFRVLSSRAKPKPKPKPKPFTMDKYGMFRDKAGRSAAESKNYGKPAPRFKKRKKK
jgi:hypothetical protein